VVPVIEGLATRLGELPKTDPAVIISIDTRCSAVAQAAISAGAGMINDTSAAVPLDNNFAPCEQQWPRSLSE
jgi:dihydropteroate synthase